MLKYIASHDILVMVSLFTCSLIFSSLTAIAQQPEQVIKLQAKRYAFSPSEITLQKDVPVILEMTSIDVHHGFSCPELGLHADIYPGKATTLRFVPEKTGTFTFHCDVYCGEGHEDMTGVLIVTE